MMHSNNGLPCIRPELALEYYLSALKYASPETKSPVLYNLGNVYVRYIAFLIIKVNVTVIQERLHQYDECLESLKLAVDNVVPPAPAIMYLNAVCRFYLMEVR